MPLSRAIRIKCLGQPTDCSPSWLGDPNWQRFGYWPNGHNRLLKSESENNVMNLLEVDPISQDTELEKLVGSTVIMWM